MSAHLPIPFTVIGGFLGAGKTTLLNRILRENAGRRIAVIVNDFGAINIDASLVVSADGETIELSNGCICCSLAAEFPLTLYPLLEREPRLDAVVIEASGVSDPWKIGQFGTLPGFRLDGVIVVTDAETVRERAADPRMGRQIIGQLQSADIIVLNKVDLVSTEDVAATRHWLAEVIPGVRIIDAVEADVPLALLLGAHADRVGEAHREAMEDHPFESRSWEIAGPIGRAQIEAWAAALPAEVIRAKGVLALEDDAEREAVFQLVGKRWKVRRGEPWGDRPRLSRLVAIGLPGSLEGLEFP